MKRFIYLDVIYPESHEAKWSVGRIPHVPLKIPGCVPWGFRGWSRREGPRERKTLVLSHSTNFGDTLADQATSNNGHWLVDSPTISPLLPRVHIRHALSLDIRLAG